MKFVRTEDLKAGMRLAKPIYNKKGVLLYERNSALTAPGIASAKNFGLIGVYILEPAEPLPPLSREDLEFEQLQTVYIFRLREVLNCITERRKLEKYPVFLEDILSHYGSLKHRVNFKQNLRSSDDFMYKHASAQHGHPDGLQACDQHRNTCNHDGRPSETTEGKTPYTDHGCPSL